MPLTDSEIAEWFREVWTKESHSAPWKAGLESLSAQQALWVPPGGKRCIWHIVRHVAFWRELYLRILDGEKRNEDEVKRRNWEPLPEDTSDAAWRAEIERFDALTERVSAAIESSPESSRKLIYFMEHDSYHFGQIMLLRTLQGVEAIDTFG
jgi:uncharacterized damage-inducible protein DinB